MLSPPPVFTTSHIINKPCRRVNEKQHGLVRTWCTVGDKDSTSTFGCDSSRDRKQLGVFISGFLPRPWEKIEVSYVQCKSNQQITE